MVDGAALFVVVVVSVVCRLFLVTMGVNPRLVSLCVDRSVLVVVGFLFVRKCLANSW